MSNFIEINSSYRNRYEYPNPAEFNIPVNSIIDCPKPNLNSQSNAYPFYNFSGSKFLINDSSTDPMKNFIGYYPKIGSNLVWGENNIYNSGNSGIPNLPISLQSQGQPSELNSSNCDNYYDGCQAQTEFNILGGNIPSPNESISSSLIKSYNGTNRACSLESPLVFWEPNQICRVINVSKGTGTNSFIKILGGENIEEYYTNSYLEDVSILKKYSLSDRFKFINKYTSPTRDAYLDSGFPEDSWSISDRYRNRGDIPCIQGFETNLVTNEKWLYDENGTLCNSGIGKYSNSTSGILECIIIDPGTNYKDGVYTTGLKQYTTLNTKGPVINVLKKDCKGQVIEIDVVFPGIDINFIIGQRLYLFGGDNNCIVEISKLCQMVDISPAIQEDSKGVVDKIIKQQDVYNGYTLYVPVLGPEYKSRINFKNIDYSGNINNNCNDPPYYQELPCLLQLENDNNSFKNIPFDQNTSGTSIIEKTMYLSETFVKDCGISFSLELEQLGYKTTMFLLIKNPFNLKYSVPIGTSISQPINENKFKIVDFDEFIYQQDWEIMKNFLNDDNLTYDISTLSNQQASCYELTLLNLTLPNVTIKSFIGGLISFYPFVYVEIQNVGGANSGAPFIINSNNPNAKSAVFKIPISDVPTPFLSKFVKIQGGTNQQNMKFKPTDNLKFRVFFGNGETYTTEDPDNCPPCFPNPLLQITCLLQIKKL